MSYKIPLHKMMKAIDAKDRNFYDSLTEVERKSFSGYIAMRWSSTVTDNPDLTEYYIRSANHNANMNIFELSKHPKLQWLMVTAVSPGFGQANHEFVKHKPKPKDSKSKIKKQLAVLYPDMKDDDLTVLSSLTTQRDITAYKKLLGDA